LARPPLGLERLIARAGVRPALLQALSVALAFALAGVLTTTVTEQLQTKAMQERVRGELRSLDEEYGRLGSPKLAGTIAKRTFLWRGFGYRLVSPRGRLLAGELADTGGSKGWVQVPGLPGDAAHGRRPYLVFSKDLPDGSRLSVGQDRSAQVLQFSALLRALVLSGACGMVFGMSVSYAFSRRSWRRVDHIAGVARRVQAGAFDARAPTHEDAPRDDLDDLALTFNAMLDRIAALMAQVRQVSRDLAHDLRTPLNRVRHRLERLRLDAETQPAFAARIEQIEDDMAEILRTFEALLRLAEIEADASEDRDLDVDLAQVAVDVGEALRADIEEGDRRLEIATTPALIGGNRQLIAQAVANLLENAARYTPIGSRIALRVTGGATPELVVEDNGAGIPAHQRDIVFRPMVRLESSRHLPGSGLGLSIVAAVVARHKASISLEDARPGLRVVMRFEPTAAS
jgi:signal transduction histidine kinase